MTGSSDLGNARPAWAPSIAKAARDQGRVSNRRRMVGCHPRYCLVRSVPARLLTTNSEIWLRCLPVDQVVSRRWAVQSVQVRERGAQVAILYQSLKVSRWTFRTSACQSLDLAQGTTKKAHAHLLLIARAAPNQVRSRPQPREDKIHRLLSREVLHRDNLSNSPWV